jgi:hypothetical protein
MAGSEAFCQCDVETLNHEYLLRRNPGEYVVNIYPTGWWGPNFSGTIFQQGVDTFTRYLNKSKQEAKKTRKFVVRVLGQQREKWTTCLH